MSFILDYIERIVAFSCRNARGVIIACLIAAAAAATYTANGFAINTDSETLTSPNLTWRKTMARFDHLFPQRNNLVLVMIDGATPEKAQSAADALAAKLSTDRKNFPEVRRPDGGPFFERNGMLYLSEAQVREATQKLIAAQPFLGAISADPSLRGVMASLDIVLLGVNQNRAKLSDIGTPMSAFADSLDAAAKGDTKYLSWSGLMGGFGDLGGDRRRAFIEVQPKLDYDDLSPGAKASGRIREAARALGLTPDKGVTVRLTGPVPLADEEFSTLAENAGLMGAVMLILMVGCLWLAVRSFRLIFCILTTLITGLIVTAAAGLMAVGSFNILSVAFIALFVGLGVDFAIQFSVRYRSARFYSGDLQQALKSAGRRAGIPLALAAAATGAGFFSFLPTDYLGVGELGLIAGIGMIVAFSLSITLLPALIFAVKPAGETERIGFAAAEPVDRFIVAHRNKIVIAGFVAAVAALATLPWLKFDSNPLDLRSRHVESVAALYDLMKDPQTSPYTIDVMAPSLDAAAEVGATLEKKPEIGMALTLKSFLPDNQEAKLAEISDAAMLLDTTINPIEIKPAPNDADLVRALTATAGALNLAASKTAAQDARGAQSALRLARALDALAAAPPEARKRATEAMIPGFRTLLSQIGAMLQANEVTLDSMPKEMHDEWIAKDGTARISVFPKTAISENADLKKFSDAVLSVSPNATGGPITIDGSGKTIVRAFLIAGLLSFVAIVILLFVMLRRPLDIALAVVPLLLAALLTLATCTVTGLKLNFANIIALPLLLGIGVAFDIYFLMAWRSGTANLLQSSLARAVVFSAMTTATGFGSLVLSSHPGTASMGILLMISLFWVLFTTLFFMPALLGPPPTGARRA
jgi:uncharacterized protein